MKFFLFLLVIGVLCSLSVLVSSSVFAATVNCNLAVQNCIGTNSADTMTMSNLRGGPGVYFIDPKGGDDTVAANVVDRDPPTFGFGFVVLPSGGNDKIAVKEIFPLATIEFYGGDGTDTIKYNGAPEAKLFQAEFDNNPDGEKDTLNCGNAPLSVAFISLEDGDVAVNCKTVKTQPNP